MKLTVGTNKSCWFVLEKDCIFLKALEDCRVLTPTLLRLVKFNMFVFSLGDNIKWEGVFVFWPSWLFW